MAVPALARRPHPQAASAQPRHVAKPVVVPPDVFDQPVRSELEKVRLHGTSKDRAEYQKIRHFLSQSATGRAALKFVDRHDLNVRFASGSGSSWNGHEIVLSRRDSFQSTALTLVHEVEHAKTDLRGTSPNFDRIQKLSRRDFVRQAVTEEVRGTVRSIDAKRELQKKGVNTGGAVFPLEKQYDAAYERAVSDYSTRHPGTSQARLDAIGRRAGRARVERGFWHGEVVTSTNGRTYPQYYGHAWDLAHGR